MDQECMWKMESMNFSIVFFIFMGFGPVISAHFTTRAFLVEQWKDSLFIVCFPLQLTFISRVPLSV
jgi:hypothetical protein